MKWPELEKASLAKILAWAETQSWCHAMATCPQDIEWHSEGDVWTHTKMVCCQLLELDEWSTLLPEERTVLIFTALFHDAAKPLTTQTDPTTGRITTPNHAIKGEQLVRNVLRKIGCGLIMRERIAMLVRYHGRPGFLHEREEPQHEVARLSWLVNNRLLYLFAVADTRGRKTASMSRPEENLHYWKLQCDELECFEKPYSFANDQARLQFFRQDHPNLHYVPHEEFACEVTMVCGLPGSGKDTWLGEYRQDIPTVALDKIRQELNIDPTENQGQVVQLGKERCRTFLRNKTSFSFNATNLLKQTRARWISLFLDYNARVTVVYLEPPIQTILRQNRDRELAVPERAVLKLAAKAEPPTWSEAHQLILSEGETT